MKSMNEQKELDSIKRKIENHKLLQRGFVIGSVVQAIIASLLALVWSVL